MDRTQQAVSALLALTDGELAQAVAAAAADRPALAALRSAALVAAASAWGQPARPPAPGDPAHGDAAHGDPLPPLPTSAVPQANHPDVLDGELVTDTPPLPPPEPTADPFGRRAGLAAGAAELDAESAVGRATAASYDERRRAGRDRLAEIRRSMGPDTPG